jgi:UTP--glucose-1-phosphate uridylyltransferase
MNKFNIKKAVLADAGYATRFLPITKTLPKSMLPILDKPITQYIIEECITAGIKEIILVATEEGKPFYEDYFNNTVQHIYSQLAKRGKESRFHKVSDVFSLPNVIVITQNKDLPYGNAAPLLSAKPYLGTDEAFLYLYTDDFILGHSACKDLVDEYYSSPDDIQGIIAVQDIPGVDSTRYGIVKLKDGTTNQLDYIIEKPNKENAPTELVSFGRYLLTEKIFHYLHAKEDELGLDSELWTVDAIVRMAKEHPVLVKPITGQWKTTGDPVNYLKTTIEFAIESPEYNGEFKEYLKCIANEIEGQKDVAKTEPMIVKDNLSEGID